MKKNGQKDEWTKKVQSKLQPMPLGITTELNEYVHKDDFHPDGRTFNTAWDNLEPFFDVLWAKFK